jgi:hypothetical protein
MGEDRTLYVGYEKTSHDKDPSHDPASVFIHVTDEEYHSRKLLKREYTTYDLLGRIRNTEVSPREFIDGLVIEIMKETGLRPSFFNYNEGEPSIDGQPFFLAKYGGVNVWRREGQKQREAVIEALETGELSHDKILPVFEEYFRSLGGLETDRR